MLAQFGQGYVTRDSVLCNRVEDVVCPATVVRTRWFHNANFYSQGLSIAQVFQETPAVNGFFRCVRAAISVRNVFMI